MANYDDHITQAKKNLAFLENINRNCNESWDWQVTVCFYTAVHLICAFIATAEKSHYDSHTDTLNAINPSGNGNKLGVTEDLYLAYRKLFNSSIRSRYLTVHKQEKTADYSSSNAYLTHSRHMQKAIEKLDVVLSFMNDKYKVSFSQIDIDCIDIKKGAGSLRFFNYKQVVA